MNLTSKVVLTTLVVLMVSSGLIITPSYAAALTLHTNTKGSVALPTKAMRCPNGTLAPNNNVSQCPPLVSSTKSDNQSPNNPNYKAQANQVIPQVPGNAVVASQATQAHNTQNSKQATNAHQATQAQQAHEVQSKPTTTTSLQMPNTAKYQIPTLKTSPKYPMPTLKIPPKYPVPKLP